MVLCRGLHYYTPLGSTQIDEAASWMYFLKSRYCKCWEYPLWYDPLRFILSFSICYRHLLQGVLHLFGLISGGFSGLFLQIHHHFSGSIFFPETSPKVWLDVVFSFFRISIHFQAKTGLFGLWICVLDCLYILPLPRNVSKLIILGQFFSGSFGNITNFQVNTKSFLGSFSDVSLGSFRIFFVEAHFRGGKFPGEFSEPKIQGLGMFGTYGLWSYLLIASNSSGTPSLTCRRQRLLVWAVDGCGVGDEESWWFGVKLIPRCHSMYGISGALALAKYSSRSHGHAVMIQLSRTWRHLLLRLNMDEHS